MDDFPLRMYECAQLASPLRMVGILHEMIFG
jgi:hypothetical protein